MKVIKKSTKIIQVVEKQSYKEMTIQSQTQYISNNNFKEFYEWLEWVQKSPEILAKSQ